MNYKESFRNRYMRKTCACMVHPPSRNVLVLIILFLLHSGIVYWSFKESISPIHQGRLVSFVNRSSVVLKIEKAYGKSAVDMCGRLHALPHLHLLMLWAAASFWTLFKYGSLISTHSRPSSLSGFWQPHWETKSVEDEHCHFILDSLVGLFTCYKIF